MTLLVDLDAPFSALADPTRRKILSRLALGEATVMELAKPFAISQPAVSRHIKVLEEAGLLTRRVDGASRRCRIATAGFVAIDEWLGGLRDVLETNYARLDAVLANMDEEN